MCSYSAKRVVPRRRLMRYCAETLSSKMKKIDYVNSGWNNSLEICKPIRKAKNDNIARKNKFLGGTITRSCGTSYFSDDLSNASTGASKHFDDLSIAQNTSSNNTRATSWEKRTENIKPVKMYGTEIFMGIPWYYETSIYKNKLPTLTSKTCSLVNNNKNYLNGTISKPSFHESKQLQSRLETDSGPKLDRKSAISLVRIDKSECSNSNDGPENVHEEMNPESPVPDDPQPEQRHKLPHITRSWHNPDYGSMLVASRSKTFNPPFENKHHQQTHFFHLGLKPRTNSVCIKDKLLPNYKMNWGLKLDQCAVIRCPSKCKSMKFVRTPFYESLKCRRQVN